MNSTRHLGDTLRDNFIRVAIFVSLSFIWYFLYLDWQYQIYLEDYRNTQRQEEQAINEKIRSTIGNLRVLTEAIGKSITSGPENYGDIQTTLKTGISFSQKDNLPNIQDVSYYKLSDPKAIITPSVISPLPTLALALRKPVESLTSMTTQNNIMIGTIPVMDQNKRLKGMLEIKVPFLDIQKFVGVDKLKTLQFPQIFNGHGKQVIQTQPLDFSFKEPLSYSEYFKSHESYFWILAYAVFIGSILLFLSGIVVKKRTSLAFGAQIDLLSKEFNSLSTYSSLQRHMIQQFRELSRAIHKSMERVRRSYHGSPISVSEKQTLIKTVAELAEDLSSGIWSNHKKESLNMKNIIDQIVLYFSNQIQKLNIKIQITCAPDLSFMGDPLFVKMILLNSIGYPLFSMPKQGEVSISVTEENGFIHINIQDNRYSLSEVGKQYFKIPFEFFVESQKLQQICLQNGVGYKSFKTTKGAFHTKVSFPLDSPDQVLNALSFPCQGSSLIH